MKIVGHNELLILQGLINLVLIRIAQQRVIAKTEERFNWIGIFQCHGAKNIGRVCHMAAHHKICVGKPQVRWVGSFNISATRYVNTG